MHFKVAVMLHTQIERAGTLIMLYLSYNLKYNVNSTDHGVSHRHCKRSSKCYC